MEKDFDTTQVAIKVLKNQYVLTRQRIWRPDIFDKVISLTVIPRLWEKTMFSNFIKGTKCEDSKMVWKSEGNTNFYLTNKFQSSFDLIFLRSEERSIHPCIKSIEGRSGAGWVRY